MVTLIVAAVRAPASNVVPIIPARAMRVTIAMTIRKTLRLEVSSCIIESSTFHRPGSVLVTIQHLKLMLN
jgi:hypothetical protein